jgi:pimeloyl-ACP methyl ester carboxylesterase
MGRHDQQVEHGSAVQVVQDRVLADAPVRRRWVTLPGGTRVHVLETGVSGTGVPETGPATVFLHGTGNAAAFQLPMLRRLTGLRAIAPDRPGQGLSDPVPLARQRYRQATTGWLDQLLDALELESAAFVGHSMGGVWAMWYALDRPQRVDRLAVIGAPALPDTRAPLPFRLLATPVLGAVVPRLSRPSPQGVLKFASFVGEREALAGHPDLVDLMVAINGDRLCVAVRRAETQVIVSPFAMVSRSGFRRRERIEAAELRSLSVPTLVIWGDRDPVGTIETVRAWTGLIPEARLEVLPAGHAPWLGHPERMAALVSDFVREPLPA